MQTLTMQSEEARLAWRTILDTAAGGGDVVIKRHNKPTAVLIGFDDYLTIIEELEEQRDARIAQAIYEEWKADPSTAIPWEEFKEELIRDGLIDE